MLVAISGLDHQKSDENNVLVENAPMLGGATGGFALLALLVILIVLGMYMK